jgi:hypothetical protein
MTVPATPSAYAPYAVQGTAMISGQAFLTTRGGDVKRAAGEIVTLDPATEYARQWYAQIGTSSRQFSETPPDTLFRKARQTTTADADGKFVFDSLPAGDYLVRTTVTWEVPGVGYAMDTQGGVVSALVHLKSGERRSLVVNNRGSALGGVSANEAPSYVAPTVRQLLETRRGSMVETVGYPLVWMQYSKIEDITSDSVTFSGGDGKRMTLPLSLVRSAERSTASVMGFVVVLGLKP